MPIFFRLRGASDAQMRLITALLIVYIVWGTTYHALNVAMQTLPPLLMNGARFVAAGAVMLALARWQGQAWPTAAQWRHSALIGGLMAFGAMGLVVLAQRMGIGSGLMATVVTTMPMWLALWTRWGGERVPVTSWLGGLLAFGAPMLWSIGSYASRKLDLPPPAMASGAQWLLGGAMGVLTALWWEPATQVWQWQSVSAASLAAWLYLVVAGTLVTLNAYLWLLKNAPPALAGSYSFVNPVVALWVGVALGGERLTGQVFVALPLILGALALIIYGPALLRWWQARRGVPA